MWREFLLQTSNLCVLLLPFSWCIHNNSVIPGAEKVFLALTLHQIAKLNGLPMFFPACEKQLLIADGYRFPCSLEVKKQFFSVFSSAFFYYDLREKICVFIMAMAGYRGRGENWVDWNLLHVHNSLIIRSRK